VGFIIGGHQRTGTSIMYVLCNEHPDIAMTLEFANYEMVGETHRAYLRWTYDWWWEKRHIWFMREYKEESYRFLRHFAFTTSYMARMYRPWKHRVTVDMVDSALNSMFPHANIVGDKYPDYIFHIDRLINYNPLKFMVMYRDARDVASSTLRKARTDWKDIYPFVGLIDTAEKVSHRWNRAIELQEKHLDNPKLLLVRYEDMILQPKDTMNRVGEWLGVDPDLFPVDSIHDTSIGKYKKGLTVDEIAIVEEITRPTMERLGYEI
jgi:hypothetical protein